jgi:hypothetical protein
MWPISMPRVRVSGPDPSGAGITLAHLGDVDGAVRGEVAPGHQIEHVVAVLVGAGDPAGTRDHPRVDQVAHLRGVLLPQRPRPDVSLHQGRTGGEVLLAEGLGYRRLQGGRQPALVDLAVAGQPDRQRLLGAVGGRDHEHHILEGVGAGPGPIDARLDLIGHRHQGVDGRHVRGLDDLGGRHLRVVQRLGSGNAHRLDIGGIASGRAHEGVLAVGRDRQELLGARSAHRPRHRLDDGVVEAEPVEDPDVGLAMPVVGGVQAGVVDVEGVGVLHHELAAAQDSGAGTGLVAVLGLDLVERQRQVLVGGVEVLHQEGEHLLVGGPQQHVDVLAVLQPEQVVAVLDPAVGLLVGLRGQQGREEHLLGAHGVHLLADDALHLAQHLQAQRQPGVDAGGRPPDVPGAHQPAVAGNLGVGGILPQGPDEQLRHARQHVTTFPTALSPPPPFGVARQRSAQILPENGVPLRSTRLRQACG